MGTRWIPRAAMAALKIALVAAVAVPATAAEPGESERAIALYDVGRYAEARALLERLDATGGIDGPMLYRLSFCFGKTGDPGSQQSTLQRAVAALSQEVQEAPTLEPAFYLANALRNLNRKPEAREVAIEAVKRIEGGDWSPKGDPVESFRAAKLYADLGRQEDAAEWYRRALEGFDAKPEAYPVYVEWSRRYLAGLASSSSDYEALEAELTALAATGQAGASDWDRLAVIRVRLGKWSAAADAWREAEKANPAEGDRARYSWRLAAMAATLDSVPDETPDGGPFKDLGQGELEELMKEQGQRVMGMVARAAAEPLSDEERKAMTAEIDAIKPVFVAACLEYTARELPIRETVFFGGYAPLIFHETRWDLPEPAPAPESEKKP